jgi:arylsulfatase
MLSRLWGRACWLTLIAGLLLITYSPHTFAPRAGNFRYFVAFAFSYLLVTMLVLAGTTAVELLQRIAPPLRSRVLERTMAAFLAAAAIVSCGALAYSLLPLAGFYPQPTRLGSGPALVLFGVAWVTGVAMGSRLDRWFDRATRLLKEGSVALVCVSAVIVAGNGLSERGMYTAPRGDAGAGAPAPRLILQITLDSLTRYDMSVYGYRLDTTPRLAELTRSWTVFERAHSTGNGTLGIMPTILTGRYPYSLDRQFYSHARARGAGSLNLLEALGDRGYERVFVQGGSISPIYHDADRDFDAILRSGLGWYLSDDWANLAGRLAPKAWSWFVPRWIPLEAVLPEPYSMGPRTQLTEPLYGYLESWLTDRAQSPNQPPLFLYLHMLRPHVPYLANEFQGLFLPIEEGFADFRTQISFAKGAYQPSEQPTVDRLRLRYDESIRKADAQVGHLLDELKRLGLYDDALILISADHGSSFGGGWRGYYSPMLLAAEHAIPLLVKFPGQTAGARVDRLVSNVDIMPTILDAAGISYHPEAIDGESLARNAADPSRVVYVLNMNQAAAGTYAALAGDLKVVQRVDGKHAFDLAADPGETTNVINRAGVARLAQTLDRFAQRVDAVRAGESLTAAPPLVKTVTADPIATARPK